MSDWPKVYIHFVPDNIGPDAMIAIIPFWDLTFVPAPLYNHEEQQHEPLRHPHTLRCHATLLQNKFALDLIYFKCKKLQQNKV